MQVANRQPGPVRAEEARESEEERRLPGRTERVRLKREEDPALRQLERKRSLAAENPKAGRACMMAGAP